MTNVFVDKPVTYRIEDTGRTARTTCPTGFLSFLNLMPSATLASGAGLPFYGALFLNGMKQDKSGKRYDITFSPGWNSLEVCLVVPADVIDVGNKLTKPIWFGLNIAPSANIEGLSMTSFTDSPFRNTLARRNPIGPCTFFDLAINTPAMYHDRVGLKLADTELKLYVTDNTPRYLLKVIDFSQESLTTNMRVKIKMRTQDLNNRPIVDSFFVRLV
jgi:hypothetical protein